MLPLVPHPGDLAELVGELVRGWCAFDGASEDVWASIGDERKDVEATQSSALEVSRNLTLCRNGTDADHRFAPD